MNIVEQHRGTLASIHGVTVAGIEKMPLEGVLVEIFDHPEIVLKNGSQTRTGQKRLAACVTGKDGRFAFDPEPGKYEVRFSRPIEWNCKSLLVEVSDSADKKRRLSVQMELAH